MADAYFVPSPAKSNVVDGDSIMLHWTELLPASFPAGFVNSGLSGAVTSYLLAHFPDMVLKYRPSIVTLEGGVNDLINDGAYDPTSYSAMVVWARSAGCCVIAMDVIPAGIPAASLIPGINSARKTQALAAGCHYVDCFAALATSGAPNTSLYLPDLIHLNAAGYAVLAPLIAAQIALC